MLTIIVSRGNHLLTRKGEKIMGNICIVNKKVVAKNQKLKRAQRKSRKHYQRKMFEKVSNVPKAKIRKLAELDEILFEEYKIVENKANGISLPALSKEQLIGLCKRVELTGRSGNGFPTYRKLESFQEKNGLLIINAVECDPGLVHDAWIYKNRMDEVLEGVKLIKHSLEIREVILATKEPLNHSLDIKQMKVADRFPMGYEKCLIKAVTGKDIPAGKHPAECGIVVLNLQTILAIVEAAADEKKAKEKYITIADVSEAAAKVTRVTLGDSISDIASKLFTDSQRKGKTLYTGSGALTCHAVNADETVTEETCYIAIGNAPEYEKAGKCKSCNACTKNCPAGVEVQKIVKLSEKNFTDDMVKSLRADACIGCGACTYGCMAGKDVREVIRCAKEKL